jgi:hypothetical protein
MNRSRVALTLASITLLACKPDPATLTPEATAADPTPADEGAIEPATGDAGATDAVPSEGGEAGEPGTPGTPEAGKSYDFVVSFYSPGDGTDGAAFDRLTAIVKETKGLTQVTGRWGREGEHDECFTLTGLGAAERAAFIARVRKEVGNSKKVNISENAECQNNPR